MASVLEVAAVLVGATAVAGSLFGVIHVLTERSEQAEKLFDRWYSRSRESRGKRNGRGRPVRPEAIAAGMVTAVRLRNRQTGAQKLMSIRRVDARTGGDVTVSSAIVHYLVSQAFELPLRQVTLRATDRRGERLKALAPDLGKLSREHPDDVSGLLRDGYKLRAATCSGPGAARRSHKLMHERGANVFTPLALTLLGRIALHVGCVFVLPRRQSLPDLLAGIATAKTSSNRLPDLP